MRAFDHIYVHPTFSPEPSSSTPSTSAKSGDKWQYAVVGTAVTMAVASGLGAAVGIPGFFTSCVYASHHAASDNSTIDVLPRSLALQGAESCAFLPTLFSWISHGAPSHVPVRTIDPFITLSVSHLDHLPAMLLYPYVPSSPSYLGPILYGLCTPTVFPAPSMYQYSLVNATVFVYPPR